MEKHGWVMRQSYQNIGGNAANLFNIKK